MGNFDSGWAIGVIGSGRLGGAFIDGLVRCGHRVHVLWPDARARPTHWAPAVQTWATECALVDRVAWVFLTVPDGEIGAVAQQLPVDGRHTVVHCSGATPLRELDGPRALGARVACFHPLQTFPVGCGGERFQGVTVGVEGSDGVEEPLRALARDLGAEPLSMRNCDRVRYHAAAVLVSNHMIALLQAATECWSAAGLPVQRAQQALWPLMKGAVDGLAGRTPAAALTGPLTRGDVQTVRAHLSALRADNPELAALYSVLSQRLLSLGPPVGGAARDELHRLLAADGGD